MKKQNVRTLALIICTFTYLLVGAAIFDAFEAKNEREERDTLNRTEYEIRFIYNMTDEHYDILRRTILKSKPHRAGIQWKFTGAFYFALSVITTIVQMTIIGMIARVFDSKVSGKTMGKTTAFIFHMVYVKQVSSGEANQSETGYGHTTPKTVGGKAFCVVYAFIGIPLNIVMFQSIGERFNIGVTFVVHKIKKCFRFKNPEVSQTELTILATILCFCVLFGGAALFHYSEKWDFGSSFYYCFITMSTIGFGDFVALQNESEKPLQKRPDYVAFCIIYILLGLTVFAAALNLMVLRLVTMNTADERKDELEALEAERRTPKVDGDVIRPIRNGHIRSPNNLEEGFHLDINSKTKRPSWRRYSSSFVDDEKMIKKIRKSRKSLRSGVRGQRYSAKRSPCNSVVHLIPMHTKDFSTVSKLATNTSLAEDIIESPKEEEVVDEHHPDTHSLTTPTEGTDGITEAIAVQIMPKRYSC